MTIVFIKPLVECSLGSALRVTLLVLIQVSCENGRSTGIASFWPYRVLSMQY